MEENMEAITRFFSGLALTFARLKDVRTPTWARAGSPKKRGPCLVSLIKSSYKRPKGFQVGKDAP